MPSARKLPLAAVLANACGVFLIAAGLLGLFAPEAVAFIPALADRTTAWTLLAAGVAVDVGAVITILSHLQSRASR